MTGLGFAGLGWLGESLLKDLPRFPNLHLAGVQDIRSDLAAALAERYASPWFGAEYADLLAQPGVEAVVICTPNALHVPQARLALEAGKHVLVQKPLALSGAEARTLVELARRRQRVLFVDYTYRFLATVNHFGDAVNEIVASGNQIVDSGTNLRASGTQSGAAVTHLSAVFHNIYGPGSDKAWFFDPRLSGGGALIDLGVHLLDLALWLLAPAEVHLLSADLQPASADIDYAAHLRLLLDQVPFDLQVSWNAPRPHTEIHFDLDTRASHLSWHNVDGSFFHFRTEVRTESGTKPTQRILLDRQTSLREDTLRAFDAALRSGQVPPIDVRVYDLLDQAYRRAPSHP